MPGAREKAASGDVLFGNIDSWLVWNLTGGADGGCHITDVTNASRTQLMDLQTLAWDEEILRLFDIPRACLPEIRSSSEVYGEATDDARRRADRRHPRRSAGGARRRACFQQGEAKNTYGTGCFMLMNTGETLPFDLRPSHDGRLPLRAGEGGLRPRGLHRDRRRARAMAADNLGLIEKSSGDIGSSPAASRTTAA